MYIKEYPSAMSEDVISAIVSYREQKYQGSYKDLIIWKNDKDLKWQEIEETIRPALNKVINNYLQQFSFDLSDIDLDLLGVGIIKQYPGVHDETHFDTNVVKNKEKIYIRPFVCLMYLNDDFEGGQLMFPAQKKVISPVKGKVVIFPCSYMFPHQVVSVAAGERTFIRFNYCFKSKDLIDKNLDDWDYKVDGIQAYE